MRIDHVIRWGPLVALLTAGACMGESRAPDSRFQIKTAPLKLTGIDEAIYTVTVENALGQTVWEQVLGSNQYGDGEGAITYVGPCDASANANPNTITVSLDQLVDDDGVTLTDDDWVRPPPVTKDVDCVENADTLVVFNITVVRSANQGFFDIAVNFEDVFCSAKLDCLPELLHDPATGARGLTAVVAFACTAGKDERTGVQQDTTLYWGDAAIVCRNGPVSGQPDDPPAISSTYPLNPGAGQGNQGPIYANPDDEDSDGVYEWAIYRTVESFADVDKCAWVTAIGLDLAKLGPNCSFQATATAADHRFEDPYLHTPADTIYPFIRWDVPLTGQGGQLLCGAHALDVTDSGVETEYTALSGLLLELGAACGDDPFFNQLACTGTATNGPQITFTPVGDGLVVVSYGDQTIGPFALPEETTFDVTQDTCCVEPCCQEAP